MLTYTVDAQCRRLENVLDSCHWVRFLVRWSRASCLALCRSKIIRRKTRLMLEIENLLIWLTHSLIPREWFEMKQSAYDRCMPIHLHENDEKEKSLGLIFFLLVHFLGGKWEMRCTKKHLQYKDKIKMIGWNEWHLIISIHDSPSSFNGGKNSLYGSMCFLCALIRMLNTPTST